VTRGEFERRLREGTVADAIHRVPVRAGDALFLPSGRIHALGAGLVIFEIQQNSDTTYRVFDWNRVGTNGQPRALHVEQALASIDFTDFEPELVTAAWTNEEGVATRRLVDHALFSVVERRAADPVSLTWRGGHPAVVGVVTGGLTIEPAAGGERLRREAGDFVLLPAGLKEVRLDLAPGTVMLEAIPGGRGG
jgi:mannose-6-phosphate isomerase